MKPWTVPTPVDYAVDETENVAIVNLELTPDELADLAGTTPARVEMWARARILVAVDDRTPRRYARTEVRPARAVVALGPLGVPYPQLAAAADLVRAMPAGSDSEIVIHVDGLVRLDGPRDGPCWVLPLAVADGVPERAALAG